MLAIKDLLEAAHGLLDRDILPGRAGEDFRHMERLRKETLDLPSPENSELVLGRKLIHSENGDDVLKIFVTLQDTLNAAGNQVMLFTNNLRRERFGSGRERINGRIDSKLGDRALK